MCDDASSCLSVYMHVFMQNSCGCAAVREEDASTCQPTFPNAGSYLGPGQTKPGSTSPFNVGSFCVV